MGFSDYIKRAGKFIIKGIPEKKVFVNIETIQYGGILEGKHVIITGGGSGIGLAIAKKFHNEGAIVIVVGRNLEKLKKACSEIGSNSKYYKLDITDFNKLESSIDSIAKMFDCKIDILVNNAGVYLGKGINEVSDEEWDKLFDTNLKASYFVTKYFLKYFNDGSQIIMIDSDTAFINSTNPYHLTKIGIDGLTRALAKENIDKGIRVNAIAPGPTLSEINRTDPTNGLQRTDKFRVLKAEEIAEVATFLASSAATCINGQTICCDEGDSLR